MSNDTRQNIIEAGAEIIHRKGFLGTGLKEILDAAGVPKGSFYHYFKSKDDFGLAVIDHFDEYFGNIARNIFEDDSLSPLQRLDKFLTTFEGFLASNDYSLGCPIGNLSQEMADLSEPFQRRLDQSFTRMSKEFAALIEAGQQAGEIKPELDPMDTAYFLIATWHGAMIRMKATRSGEPLTLCKRMLIDNVLTA